MKRTTSLVLAVLLPAAAAAQTASSSRQAEQVAPGRPHRAAADGRGQAGREAVDRRVERGPGAGRGLGRRRRPRARRGAAARHLHHPPRRHALGPLRPLPQQPLVLAQGLVLQPGDHQPALDRAGQRPQVLPLRRGGPGAGRAGRVRPGVAVAPEQPEEPPAEPPRELEDFSKADMKAPGAGGGRRTRSTWPARTRSATSPPKTIMVAPRHLRDPARGGGVGQPGGRLRGEADALHARPAPTPSSRGAADDGARRDLRGLPDRAAPSTTPSPRSSSATSPRSSARPRPSRWTTRRSRW